jgi:hypothetical protein
MVRPDADCKPRRLEKIQAPTPETFPFRRCSHFDNETANVGTARQGMKSALPPSKSRRVLLVALPLIVVAAMLFLLVRQAPSEPAPPPVLVLDSAYKIPPQKGSLFERMVPMRPGWGWLWRMRDRIAGPRKAVNLEGGLWDLSGASETALSGLCPGKPDAAETNGLKIWLLGNEELKGLRQQLKQTPGSDLLYLPRIMTSDGRQSRMMSGSSTVIGGLTGNVGLAIDLLPRTHESYIDLTAIVTLTGLVTNMSAATPDSPGKDMISVQTNFAAAARMQVTNGGGVFLLDTAPVRPHQKRIGVIISAGVPPKK